MSSLIANVVNHLTVDVLSFITSAPPPHYYYYYCIPTVFCNL